MTDYLIIAAFLALPIGILVWFVVSLVEFLRTPKEKTEIRRNRAVMLITSAVILAVIVIAIVAIAVLFSLAITHM